MWRAASWRPKIVRVSKASVLALNWAKDGTIQVATGDGSIQRLSASSLSVLSSKGKTAKWAKAQFSDDGRILVGSDFRHIEVWNTTSGRKLWSKSLPFYGGNAISASIITFALSPRSDRLMWIESIVNNHSNKGIFVNDINDNRVTSSALARTSDGFVNGHTGFAFAFSPDGRLLASNNFFGKVHSSVGVSLNVWDLRAQKFWRNRNTTSPQNFWADCLLFSPDGHVLAAAFNSGTTALYNATTGAQLVQFSHPSPGIKALVFSPDARTIATAAGNYIKLWNTRTGVELWHIVPRTSPTSLAFSPDGSTLAVGTSNGQVQLWRIK